MEMDLLKARINVMKFGQMDGENRNIDLYCFTHPLYWERDCPGLYEEYKKAFVTFEINNN